MNYLLDTNVVSELIRRDPEPRVVDWFTSTPESSLYLCALTLGEIQNGIAGLPAGNRRTELTVWFSDLREAFRMQILPIDQAVALRWGHVNAEAKSRGRRLSVIDGLIAACALVNEVVLVTRNIPDFEATGAELLNPWPSPADKEL